MRGKEERLTCAQVKIVEEGNAKRVALFFTRGTVGGNANKPQTTDQKIIRLGLVEPLLL